MAFQPDILITTRDGVTLVVEANVALPNLECAEEDLKQYMVSMQCPTGILITPSRMWLYRDSYATRSPQSIRVGEFSLARVWRQQGSKCHKTIPHVGSTVRPPEHRGCHCDEGRVGQVRE